MINESNKHSWCVNADHAMSANNNGTTKICCMIRGTEDATTLTDQPIKINFDKKIFKTVRKALEVGVRHPACNWCWEEEDAGRKSKRLRDNERYASSLNHGAAPFEGLAKLELNLGNTCNLKCRTCAPHSSSQWMKEYFDVYAHKDYNNNFKQYAIEMKKYHQTFDDESPFWQDLLENMNTIKQLDFYGGEPFMSNKMWKTLQMSVDLGYAKDIELHYATNATQWPEDKVEAFRSFRHLNLNFSIDGHREQFEYMRYPATWAEATVNMEKARAFKATHHNMQLSWCVTLSTLNIFNLPDLLDTFYNHYEKDFGIYLNLVHGPIWFNISKMPEDVRGAVIERLEKIPQSYEQVWWHYLPGIINYIKNGTYEESVWEQFKTKVATHDTYRGQKYSDTFPEFAKILGL